MDFPKRNYLEENWDYSRVPVKREVFKEKNLWYASSGDSGTGHAEDMKCLLVKNDKGEVFNTDGMFNNK